MLKFSLLISEEFSYNKFKTIIVKNSFGKVQKRFSIFTKLTIGDSRSVVVGYIL